MNLRYVLLFALLLSGCAPVPQSTPIDATQSAQNDQAAGPSQGKDSKLPVSNLVQARSLWKESRIQSYEFTQQRHCFCRREYTKPIDVSVKNGEIVTATYQDSGKPVSSGVRKTVRTIDGWLDYIATRQLNAPYEFNAIFDPRDGHPIRYSVDQRENVADDTEEVWFSEFRGLP